jgi:hypothetical protein
VKYFRYSSLRVEHPVQKKACRDIRMITLMAMSPDFYFVRAQYGAGIVALL